MSWIKSLRRRVLGKAGDWCGVHRNGDFGADFVDFGPKMRLFAAYEDADDLKSRLKISAEVRLLEQSAARLVSADQNGPSGIPSIRTVKARRAARARWDRGNNAAG